MNLCTPYDFHVVFANQILVARAKNPRDGSASLRPIVGLTLVNRGFGAFLTNSVIHTVFHAAGEKRLPFKLTAGTLVAPGAVLMPTGEEPKEPAGTFPLNRRPSTEQVADAVRYLLEAPAVTGQILYVDSGQHLSS